MLYTIIQLSENQFYLASEQKFAVVGLIATFFLIVNGLFFVR